MTNLESLPTDHGVPPVPLTRPTPHRRDYRLSLPTYEPNCFFSIRRELQFNFTGQSRRGEDCAVESVAEFASNLPLYSAPKGVRCQESWRGIEPVCAKMAHHKTQGQTNPKDAIQTVVFFSARKQIAIVIPESKNLC